MKDKTLFSILSFITHPLTGLAVGAAWIFLLFPAVCAIVLRLWVWGGHSVGYEFTSAMNLVFASGAISIIIITAFIGYMGRWVDRVIIRFLQVRSHRRFGTCDQVMIERFIAKIKAAPGRNEIE